MVKTAAFLSETIFNCLGAEDCALFAALTDIFPEEYQNDGVLWVQRDENNELSAVCASGENGRTALIARGNADLAELSFVLGDKIDSSQILPFKQIDEKYLLHIKGSFDPTEEGLRIDDFAKVSALSGKDCTDCAVKIFRRLKNRCHGVLAEGASGGFISFCGSCAVITDVFTREEYRGKGLGTRTVKKLLKLSPCENVFLLCGKKNLNFYKNIGFETVKTVYEYENNRNAAE